MSKHKEDIFESELVADLCTRGWVLGDASGYDKALALYPEDLIAFIKTTQPDEYDKFARRYASNTDMQLCKHIAAQITKHGALHALRKEIRDVNARFRLCQFQPNLPSAALQAKYEANILRVVRQVYYSEHNQNSIDVVLFVNGLPVATLELKTDFTQNVHDAIAQYKYDRPPKDPATRHDEPLLTFNRGALVHFAVSTDEVYMTTQLAGADSLFLPFNRGGEDGAAGNIPNPDGYATAYLWQEVLARDSLLNILNRYIHHEVKEVEAFDGRKSKRESLIFPRYHQLNVVKSLLADAQDKGSGQRYLIQHSAGSGKSNSIAWLAHQLSSLHRSVGDAVQRVFNSVIVITDRTVLDNQLQETISQFEHKQGVVVRINRDEGTGSKSEQLTQALESGSAIIIVTIQTFPFILEEIRKRTSLKDKTYAIIADEAHSSQSGNTAKQLKQVLSAGQVNEDEEDEITGEDVLNATVMDNGAGKNISFFAFTATPKSKTLQMFGTLPDPTRPAAEDNIPVPFHVYTMRQAIEEGFILDVLKSYTTYDLAYKLATANGEKEVDEKKARGALAKFVELHPHNIAQKIEVIIEHFREHIASMLDGQAKAMVVTSSRKSAVRYKLAFDKYIAENHYNQLVAMVAFSGKVSDDGQGVGKEYTEANMNPNLKGREMRRAFDSPDYQVMIAANKFQTGFDQPKLCAMYVDKKLGGVDAVQTLSRLNRTYKGKNFVFVLDFVNKAEDVKAAFDPYYKNAQLSGVTDPNDVFDLKLKLDAVGIYHPDEVDTFAEAFFNPKGTQAQMSAAVKPAADRYKVRYKAALEAIQQAKEGLSKAKQANIKAQIKNAERDLTYAKEAKDELDLFKKDLVTYVRQYEFLSQIVNYEDVELEKLCQFIRGLLPNIKIVDLEPPLDLGDVELTHYAIKNKRVSNINLDAEKIDPDATGQGKPRDPKAEYLEKIINQLNDMFAGALSDDDKLNYARTVRDKLKENAIVVSQMLNNSKEQAMLGDFPVALENAVLDSADVHSLLAKQILTNDTVKSRFARLVFDLVCDDLRKQET